MEHHAFEVIAGIDMDNLLVADTDPRPTCRVDRRPGFNRSRSL
jgi:hypothetical protein